MLVHSNNKTARFLRTALPIVIELNRALEYGLIGTGFLNLGEYAELDINKIFIAIMGTNAIAITHAWVSSLTVSDNPKVALPSMVGGFSIEACQLGRKGGDPSIYFAIVFALSAAPAFMKLIDVDIGEFLKSNRWLNAYRRGDSNLHVTPSGRIEGYFGPETTISPRQLQERKENIKIDFIVDTVKAVGLSAGAIAVLRGLEVLCQKNASGQDENCDPTRDNEYLLVGSIGMFVLAAVSLYEIPCIKKAVNSGVGALLARCGLYETTGINRRRLASTVATTISSRVANAARTGSVNDAEAGEEEELIRGGDGAEAPKRRWCNIL